MERKKAVLLLSGGLDSTTLLALATSEGHAVYALSFSYGQRHSAEVTAARKIAAHYGVIQHVVTEIDLRAFGGSALTSDIEVPKDQMPGESQRIPVTYVPARNTIFLAFALAWAEVLGASDIFIGVNAVDYSGYPDCRPQFIEAFERMARLATRAGVEAPEGAALLRIQTPLIGLTKCEIIELGLRLAVDYGMTTSCYDPGETGESCGRCDACRLRLKGFEEAGSPDPVRYSSVA